MLSVGSTLMVQAGGFAVDYWWVMRSAPPITPETRTTVVRLVGLAGGVLAVVSVSADWLGIGLGYPGIGRLQSAGALAGIAAIFASRRVDKMLAGWSLLGSVSRTIARWCNRHRVATALLVVGALITIAATAQPTVVCPDCIDPYRPENTSNLCSEKNPHGEFVELGCAL